MLQSMTECMCKNVVFLLNIFYDCLIIYAYTHVCIYIYYILYNIIIKFKKKKNKLQGSPTFDLMLAIIIFSFV